MRKQSISDVISIVKERNHKQYILNLFLFLNMLFLKILRNRFQNMVTILIQTRLKERDFPVESNSI